MAQKVLVTKDFAQKGVKWLEERGYEVKMSVVTGDDMMIRELADVDGVLAASEPFTRPILESAKKLKVIARFGVGYDAIDLAAAADLGIWVTNTPKANSNAVAEHALALMFAVARHVVPFDREVKAGRWAAGRVFPMGSDIAGKTLGVVGFGNIGRLIGKKAALGLEMKVLAYDPFLPADRFPEYVARETDLARVFAESDFVTLHLPSTPDTRGSVNKSVFEKMKPTAYLINCARGDVVNEDDLYAALKNNVIAGAALDVMVREPLPADSPLMTLDNIVLLPHVASATYQAMDAMGLDAAKSIDEVLSGKEPTWPVNKPRKRE